MNFLIRRTSKKEYDGPAASCSISRLAEEAYVDSYHRHKKKEGDRRMDSSFSSRQSDHSVLTNSFVSGRHYQRQSRHADSSSSKKGRDHSSRRVSSSSSSSCRQRKSTDKQKELASGISSRRTKRQVKNHLPANMMSGRASSNNSSRRNSHRERHSSYRSNSGDSYARSEAQLQHQHRNERIQIPMEHDGGILCIEPVPGDSRNNSKYRHGYDDGTTHRFLSGGTDGTVKLWEVYEPPIGDSPEEAEEADSIQMIPRLVKTYRGHRSYVQSIAILGTFDPMAFKDSHHDDDGSCATEDMDDMSFSSSPYSPRKEKKGFVSNHRSSNGSKDSQLLKKLGRRKRNLFVTASRDNTLRIWELDNPNEHEEYFEDSSEEEEYHRSRKKDALRKGKKLRGHGFAINGGVLCTCAVPSLPSSEALFEDENNDGMASAGQFVSGGSDGVIRVWDVRSALNLEKAPKAGRYQTIQLQQLTPHMNETSEDEESTDAASARSDCSNRGLDVTVTSVKCTHSQDLSSISLFASYSDGTIRRFSPVFGSRGTKNAIRWCLTSILDGHQDPVTSLSLLTSPSLMPLLSPNDSEEADLEQRPKKTGTILISSCDRGVLRVWDAFDARLGQDNLESSEKSDIPIREALWEIELNDNEDEDGKECDDGDSHLPTSINVKTLKDPVSIISLTALNEGRVMAAGTTDGKIRLWDVSNGLYEGTYNLGSRVQVWSLASLSEREFYRGYDEYGELQVHLTGILVAGDDRGRLRILRKTCMHSLEEEEDVEMDQIFEETHS